MPEQEFELYLDLLARLLRMSPQQKEAIANELRDHLEARFEELVRSGTPRDAAIRQALEEFGDTAGLAHQFTRLSRREMRRWIMRGTLATAAVGAVILLVVNAFLPERANGPAPQQLAAQDNTSSVEVEADPIDIPEWEVEYIDPVQFVHPDLAQPLNVVWDSTPLSQAIEEIGAAISLPVLLDVPNLQDSGLSGESTVTDRFAEDPLYLRLNRILENVNGVPLAWLIEDDVLVMTTAEIGEEKLQTISYDVGHLLGSGISRTDLLETIQYETSGPWFDLDGIGGTISAFGEMLVARQTQRVQVEVATLLAALRSEADERVLRPAVHAELESALNSTISVDFNDVPLEEAISAIRSMTTERIEMDFRNLEDEGVLPETPVSIRMSDRPLRTAFKFMLDNVNGVPLSAITHDGTILITPARIAEERLRTTVYDVSDLVGDDPDRSAGLAELVQIQTSGPWFELDGIGGTISIPEPGLFVVRQADENVAGVRALIREQRQALLASRAAGREFDVLAGLIQTVDTRSYQMDAEAAEDLLTLLPEMVAAGTWASTVGEDGRPTPIDEDGIGVIRIVSAGRKVINLSGTGVDVTTQASVGGAEGESQSDGADSSRSQVAGDVLIIPQAALIIRHRPSVHQQISHFLYEVSRPPGTVIDDTFIPAFKDSYGGGFRRPGGFNDAGGFYSVADQIVGRSR